MGRRRGDLWDVVRWPVGLAALVVAVTTLFRFAPRRRQPGLSWLALGAALTVTAWLAASGAIAAYVSVSGEFSTTYGPLAGIMVLLLWAFVSGVALLAGVAVSAQLEAVRAGVVEPLLVDADADGVPDHRQSVEQHAARG